MVYLFDTNVVSELRRPEMANRAVLAWSATIPREDVFISAITLLELEIGIRKAELGGSGSGSALRRWMNTYVLVTYALRTLPVTGEIALQAAHLDNIPQSEIGDRLIAATALLHGLVVVTRNEKHFGHPGVRLLNPFT